MEATVHPPRPRSPAGPDVKDDPAATQEAEARAARRRLERARAIAYLDLEESRGPVALVPDDAIGDLLRATRRIAIVGASSNEARPSFGVFRYLIHQAGIPVAARGRRCDRPVRHRRCLPPLRAVRAARPRSRRDRGALSVAPARGRQLGGRADRPRRRAGGRDGPLHRHRASPDPGTVSPVAERSPAGRPRRDDHRHCSFRDRTSATER